MGGKDQISPDKRTDDDDDLYRWASDLPWLELSLRWTPALMEGAASDI